MSTNKKRKTPYRVVLFRENGQLKEGLYLKSKGRQPNSVWSLLTTEGVVDVPWSNIFDFLTNNDIERIASMVMRSDDINLAHSLFDLIIEHDYSNCLPFKDELWDLLFEKSPWLIPSRKDF